MSSLFPILLRNHHCLLNIPAFPLPQQKRLLLLLLLRHASTTSSSSSSASQPQPPQPPQANPKPKRKLKPKALYYLNPPPPRPKPNHGSITYNTAILNRILARQSSLARAAIRTSTAQLDRFLIPIPAEPLPLPSSPSDKTKTASAAPGAGAGAGSAEFTSHKSTISRLNLHILTATQRGTSSPFNRSRIWASYLRLRYSHLLFEHVLPSIPPGAWDVLWYSQIADDDDDGDGDGEEVVEGSGHSGERGEREDEGRRTGAGGGAGGRGGGKQGRGGGGMGRRKGRDLVPRADRERQAERLGMLMRDMRRVGMEGPETKVKGWDVLLLQAEKRET